MASVKGWSLKEAQELVGAMRAKVNQYGYEISVGGSVLTKGTSTNDLDLFFIPKDDHTEGEGIQLLIWLASKFGMGKSIQAAHGPTVGGIAVGGRRIDITNKTNFIHKGRFDLAGRKIDVFVV